MNVLRTLSIALLLAGALLFATATLGFVSTDTSRGISAGIVNDSEAYVGYETGVINVQTTNGSGTEKAVLVTVTNRFSNDHGGLDVSTVSTDVDNDDIEITNVTELSGIGPGDMGSITGDVVCDVSDASGTASVTIEAELTATTAMLEGETTQRQFEIDCT